MTTLVNAHLAGKESLVNCRLIIVFQILAKTTHLALMKTLIICVIVQKVLQVSVTLNLKCYHKCVCLYTDFFDNLNLGRDCEINIDDCLPNPCENNGTCIDLIDSFKCNCTDGFTGSTCSDIFDPCTQDPCLNDGNCSSFNGIVDCACKEGKCFELYH